MASPAKFRAWLQMLHCRATTRLLLPLGLSREIKVSFSFRQGDGIAGDLYCLNQEPLLRRLRTRLVGLLVTNFYQKDTTYLDDFELISGDEQDLVTFEKVMKRYEAQSGAMLSRSKKSTVMGLGQWLGKEQWPVEVHWLRSVQKMKILGFTICPTYTETLQCTWDKVFRGVQCTLYSWEKRALSTLQQRAVVLQTFALSKLWYTAQVLPIPASIVKKLEAASSAFIFRGRPERLKLAELQNPVEKGGLGLVCIVTKSECLLLRQSLRVLEREEEDCCRHLSHWIGYSLIEHFPFLDNLSPVCRSLPRQFPLHKAILEVLEEGIMREEYDPTALNNTSARLIYQNRAKDIIPPPKVEMKHPHIEFVACVYPRLANKILEPEPRDVMFSLIHNILPNKERLFQQNRTPNPFCPVPQYLNTVQDREHIFSACYLVSESWVWLRTKLLQLFLTTQMVPALQISCY